MNKEDVRKKMLDIVGDIYHADSADYVGNGFDNFDGHNWYEAKDTINKSFDRLTVDHPKVNLPREVGKELKDYQDEDIDLLDYLHDVIDSNELRTTRVWMLDDRENRIGILADAYRYGWEAEPEELFYVKAPDSWKMYGGGLNWLYKRSFSCGIDICSHTGESDEQFTRSELKKYHLDSDIFTLVPVGEGKGND